MSDRLIPDPKVRERYGVSAMTLWRWDQNPNLRFSKAVRINGRKYRSEKKLDAFDATRAQAGAA